MGGPIVLVKLGGSLITDKGRPGVARLEVIRRLAREVASLARRPGGPRLIVGHGSGSFGHAAAARSGLASATFDGTGRTSRSVKASAKNGSRPDPRSIAHTQRRAADLHAIVVAALEDAGARPFSLAPSSFMTCEGGRVAHVFADPVFAALDAGLVPVVYGDVVLDRSRGAVIVSTEEIFLALAREARTRRLTIRRAVWLGETDGVYDEEGSPVRRLSAAAAAKRAKAVSGASGVDVTGGMALRLRSTAALARRRVVSLIVDGRRRGALAAALNGHRSGGTMVEPR